ncbi:MAG: four helix bundle protein [Candidatus Omnitrophota bacterium]
MKEVKFNFEDLSVWKKSIIFAKGIIDVVDDISSDRKHFRLIEQIEAASTSVASNIAEGAGRFSRKEFINFLYIARGSLCETLTLLAIFEQNAWVKKDRYQDLRLQASEISRMISGLINSLRLSRL